MNITELAQREKFEAWAEEAGALPWGILGKHRKQDGNYPGPHYTYMWKAWQAASAELVEALEKAQQRIDELENDEVRQRLANAEHQLYMAELSKNNLRASRKAQFRKRRAAEKRIAELEESHAQVIQSRDHYKRISEEGLKKLAESRTVTVKFSPIPVEELGNVRDGKKHPYMFGAGYNAAVIHCESVIQQELDAKGIKWEAE